jgi:fumarate reductase subunit C
VEVRLYVLQRLTAAILAPLVLVHVAVIFYAMRRGLAADEILSRTRGSIAWGSYYGVFVLAAATHGSIGLRNVLFEWSPLKERAAGAAAALFGVVLLVLGIRAVAAVVLP